MGSEFLDDLGRKVTGVADVLEKKTGEVVDLAKLKSRQYAIERELKECYERLGRLVLEQYQADQPVEGSEAIVEACKKAEHRQEELKEVLDQINMGRR